jgi:hypothetical protein
MHGRRQMHGCCAKAATDPFGGTLSSTETLNPKQWHFKTEEAQLQIGRGLQQAFISSYSFSLEKEKEISFP